MNDHRASNIENTLLLNYLAGRDVPCPTCGYNLRDLHGNNCPECGHSLEVTIRVSDGSITRWVWAFASSCLSVPLALFFDIITVTELLRITPVSPTEDTALFVYSAVFTFGTMLAIILLIRQKHFLRMSVRTQRWMVRGIVFYQFAIIASFMAFMISSIP